MAEALGFPPGTRVPLRTKREIRRQNLDVVAAAGGSDRNSRGDWVEAAGGGGGGGGSGVGGERLQLPLRPSDRWALGR